MACANTLYSQGIKVHGAVDAVHALQPLVGLTVGWIVFSPGVLSMCFTTLVIEVLICDFVLSEMFNFELHGWKYKASTMLANIGILDAFYTMPFWLPVITSSFNLLMVPVTYTYFFILQNKRCYLRNQAPRLRNFKDIARNFIMILAILAVAAGAAVKILSLF